MYSNIGTTGWLQSSIDSITKVPTIPPWKKLFEVRDPVNNHGWRKEENLIVFNKHIVNLPIRSHVPVCYVSSPEGFQYNDYLILESTVGGASMILQRTQAQIQPWSSLQQKHRWQQLQMGGRYIIVILITRKFNITFWIPLSAHVEDQSWSPVELCNLWGTRLAPFTRYKHTSAGSRYTSVWCLGWEGFALNYWNQSF